MNNPCHTCLLVNNCTAICEAKENLQTLLKQTEQRYQFGVRYTNNPTTDYVKRYNFWRKLKRQNDEDMINIQVRARQLKQVDVL
jgi:acid phosphatase class B